MASSIFRSTNHCGFFAVDQLFSLLNWVYYQRLGLEIVSNIQESKYWSSFEAIFSKGGGD